MKEKCCDVLYERLRRVVYLQLRERLYNENYLCFPLTQAARSRGVDCVVAPYEADAQLAYLTKSGLAQAVITEDSDLLAFGCKTVPKKMKPSNADHSLTNRRFV